MIGSLGDMSTALTAAAATACVALGLAVSPALAGPSIEETIAFTRSEMTNLCNDRSRSQVDALDKLGIGGGRTCQVVLSSDRLSLSVRERGSELSGGAYARLMLDIRFSSESGFLCGRKGVNGLAPLFFTCQASKGAGGQSCAERNVTIDDPRKDSFESSQRLAAASIMRLDPDSCGVVARALSYIGERSKRKIDTNLRDFFASN